MNTKFERQIAFEAAHIFPRKYKNLQNIPHWHKEHELVFVASGTLTVTVNGNFFTLTEGACAFLHGEEVHSIQSEAEAVAVVVKLAPEYFDRIVGKKALQSPILTHGYGLSETLDALFCELRPETEYGGTVADAIAIRLVAEIFRSEPVSERAVTNRRTEETYKKLLDRISTDYAYISFEDAADFMHFSRPYFSKYFYAHTGMTFTRYLSVIRVSHACEMVLAGNMTATEISQSCGFNTIRNFNRVFRSLTGYPPSALPKDFRFIGGPKEYTDRGFDPTLSCTEILDP